MKKVTDIKCIDGKRHNWKKFNRNIKGLRYGAQDQGIRWCNKCGCLTEFCFNPLRKNPNQRIMIEGGGGKYVIAIPKTTEKMNRVLTIIKKLTKPGMLKEKEAR